MKRSKKFDADHLKIGNEDEEKTVGKNEKCFRAIVWRTLTSVSASKINEQL